MYLKYLFLNPVNTEIPRNYDILMQYPQHNESDHEFYHATNTPYTRTMCIWGTRLVSRSDYSLSWTNCLAIFLRISVLKPEQHLKTRHSNEGP